MSYRREIPISVSIDITIKDKAVSSSEFGDFSDRCGGLGSISAPSAENVFKFCLSVLLEQDAYGEEEIEEAIRAISELTNHEDGFNMTSKEA
tara:strand:+ start:284 stop:559 length:276 start_codon:yes stop_codon:yes gene_type:complete